MADDKKAFKEAKNDFTLHVALIEREGKARSEAQVLAYKEGRAGLKVRLTGVAS